ncbi:MAG: winged helix-turn-helix transcriptional regulator [Thermoplasmataceae archaeon]
MPDPDNVRDRILLFIEKNPGMHFREIQRQTGTAVGQLEYHLYSMEKDGSIKGEKDGKFVRYFPLSEGSFQNMILFLVRNLRKREMIFKLLREDIPEEKLMPVNEKKRNYALIILQELEALAIVSKREEEGHNIYSINNRDRIIETLVKYRESFLDYTSSNFINLFK